MNHNDNLKIIEILLLLLLLLLLVKKVSLAERSQQRPVENGPPCEKHQNVQDIVDENVPWAVSVQLVFVLKELCEGVLLSPKWVVTVAHCLIGQHPSHLKIIAGGSQSRRIDSILIHPSFNLSNQENDLALLKTRTPFELGLDITTICPLGEEQGILCRDSCRAKLKSTPGPTLVSLMDQESCVLQYQRIGMESRVKEAMTCVSGISEEGSQCIGNSGSPLTCLNSNGNHVLSGLLSLGLNCAAPSSPAIFTKISFYYKWISNSINEGDFDLLLDCTHKSNPKYIKGIREDEEGLHIDVFIPKSKRKKDKTTANPVKTNTPSTEPFHTNTTTPSSAAPSDFSKPTQTSDDLYELPSQTTYAPDVPASVIGQSSEEPNSSHIGTSVAEVRISVVSDKPIYTITMKTVPPISDKSFYVTVGTKIITVKGMVNRNRNNNTSVVLLKMSPDVTYHKRGYNIYIRQNSEATPDITNSTILKFKLIRV